MRFGEAFLELTPQLNSNAVRQTEVAARTAGERTGRAYGGGFDKGSDKAGAFGTVLATMGAKATIGAAGVATLTPAVLQLTAALVPAAGALIAYPALLLGIKTASAVTKLAIMGVGDAIDAGFTGTAKEAEKALKALPPEARTFAKSVIGLKDNLTDLQGSVSNRFFDPLNQQFDPFVNKYLPLANAELPRMAQALGATGGQFAKAATEGKLFNGVADLLQNTTLAIAVGNDNIRDMADGLGVVLSVSSTALPKLASGFDDAAGAAGRYLVQAEKTGQLQKWMDAGFATIGKLVEIFKNLGTVIALVLQAASKSSGDFLGTIVSLTDKMALFFKSVEGNQALTNFFTVTGAISTALRQGLMLILPQIGQSLAILAPAVQPLIAGFLSLVAAVSPLLPVAARLAVVIASVLAGAMTTLAGVITPMIAKLTGPGSSGEGMDKLMASAEKLGPALNDAAGSVQQLTPALNLSASAIAFMVEHTDTIIKFLPLLVAGFVAWKIAQLAANIAMAASVPIRIAEIIATRQQTAALLANATALGVATGTQEANTAVTLGSRIATLASAAASGIATAATWLWTAATTALGVAIKFAMGPVGLIIIGITALIAIIVLAYKHNETFRAIVDAVWRAIKIAIEATVNWFTQTAWPAIKSALDALGVAFNWLWKNVLVPVWNGIKVAIDVAWIIIKAIFAAIETYVRVLATIFTWLWQNVINPVWIGIKLAIQIAWVAIQIIFKTIEIAIRALALVFQWLWNNVIVPVWNGIRTAISTAWNFIRDSVFNPTMTFIRGVFTATWNFLSSLISSVWNAIKTAISAAWNWVRDNVLNPAINFVKGPLVAAWNAAKEGITSAWNAIKSPVMAVWNFIKDSIFTPLSNFITKTIPNAFTTGVNAVGAAWNKIKEMAAAPVRFMVNTVINGGIIKGFNWIAEKVGVSPISPISLGFADGGVLPGYTPGKDVHSFMSPTGGRLELSGGEAIMRPEFTKAVGSAFVNAGNSAARSGGTEGVRSFLKGFMKHGDDPQYANGGVVRRFKDGGILGGIVGGISKAWNAFTNPVDTFKSAVNGLMGGMPGGPYIKDVLQGTVGKMVEGVAAWIKTKFDAFGGAMGSGGGPGNWSAMFQWVKSRFPGAQLFSGMRNSTTLSGNKSLHASGRAIDVTPDRAISNAIIAAFGKNITELISPWKSDHVWHGQRPHDYGPALDAQHGVYGNNAHIHWAMRNGGVFKYDKGGWFNPGQVGVNQLSQPEAVLTPAESNGLKNMGVGELADLMRELIEAVNEIAPGVGGYIRGSGRGLITKARGV